MVFKGHGKNTNGTTTINIKLSTSKFLTKPAHPSSSQAFPSTSSINISGGVERITEQDIQVRNRHTYREIYSFDTNYKF